MLAFDGAINIREIEQAHNSDLTPELLRSSQPVVLRGLISDWPVVQAGLQSAQQAADYFRQWSNENLVQAFVAPPEVKGRYFYTSDLSGFNFAPKTTNLNAVLDEIFQYAQTPDSPSIYLGSTSVNHILPGFRAHNDVAPLQDATLVSIWAGTQSRIAAHYDIPDNLACCVVGKRRFTLFPPEQLENLYIGPLDHTPAGQPASLVDFYAPDYTRFPKFKEAIKHCMVVDLAPGDALFIPSMWWHHVEGLAAFNVLINYWWRQVALHMGAPTDALQHALLSIRDLPQAQRDAWRQQFEHYVFSPQSQEHIAQQHRGILNPIDSSLARKLRAMLINKLNR